ncbi:MAG: hypothetical protein ABSG43_02265 [Solirubrobacteraceae bacterium]|jgi:hypothetical protein
MLQIAAQGHSNAVIGIVFVVIGVVHLAFRRFYADRATAVNQAGRQTARGRTRALYRRRSPRFYLVVNTALAAALVIVGIILIVTS